MRIAWLARARRERDSQIDYLLERSPRAAARSSEEIDRQVDLLTDFPRMGRTGKLRGTRELVISRTKFGAVYRIDEVADVVLILRFYHGAQHRAGWKRL